jgi:hypothetical protein
MQWTCTDAAFALNVFVTVAEVCVFKHHKCTSGVVMTLILKHALQVGGCLPFVSLVSSPVPAWQIMS